MAGNTSEQKTAYWRDVFKRQAESGLSIRQFCSRERISQPSFYAWRRKLPERVGRKAGDPISRQRRDAATNAGKFIALKLVDTASALEVIHPRGCRVRITGNVDPTVLRHVLDVLDAEGEA